MFNFQQSHILYGKFINDNNVTNMRYHVNTKSKV